VFTNIGETASPKQVLADLVQLFCEDIRTDRFGETVMCPFEAYHRESATVFCSSSNYSDVRDGYNII